MTIFVITLKYAASFLFLDAEKAFIFSVINVVEPMAES